MIDALTRHQIYIQRYSTGINNKTIKTLGELNNLISQRILTSDELDVARWLQLKQDLDNIIRIGVNEEYSPLLFEELEKFAEYEVKYSYNLLNKETLGSVTLDPMIVPEQLKATLSTSTMVLGTKLQTPQQALQTFSNAFQKDVKSAIDAGYLAGLSNQDIAKSVKKLVKSRTYNQSEALVRTLTNHYGVTARNETFRQNEDLYKGWRFSATLDSRTTIICASNDGKIQSYESIPKPPLHYGCRSVILPELKDEYKLIKDSTRASKDGQVSSRLTYSGWLKKQPKNVQIEVLGKERAKLFRGGKLSLDKFVDYRGNFYTLDELKQLD